MLEAFAAGVRLFGENRVQEFQQKAPALDGQPIEVHLIGHLQSNKTAKAAELFSGIDTLDSRRVAERVNQAAQAIGKRVPVLLEIKLSPEDAKTGIAPDSPELAELLERLPDLEALECRGLMTVPPYSENPEDSRPYFEQLRRLRDELTAKSPRLSFNELSMGMSGDFEVAIEEGSTCVRIGTAIFGRRPKPV